MPAYYIALRGPMKDPEAFEEYHRVTPPTLVGREFNVLAQYGRTRTTHGADPGIVAIMEFPTFEAAEDWYDSPGYQAVVGLLYQAADMQCFILDGTLPPE
jgi:uncharacterized protein (DUF1330 family)